MHTDNLFNVVTNHLHKHAKTASSW